jgi:hypothetical protein
MHVCEDLRERITERIIDGDFVVEDVDLHRELSSCPSCSAFLTESREFLDAISCAQFEIAEEQWEGIQERMRERILADRAARRAAWPFAHLGLDRLHMRRYMLAVASVLTLGLIAVGIYRLTLPSPHIVQTRLVPHQQETIQPIVEQDLPLDPVTLDFLEQSELLLRDIMKLRPGSIEDIREVRKLALQQLIGMDQRREAVSDMLPVLSVMDQSETVLRDVRNLPDQAASQDIADVQGRIERNGLIANLKAFQPRLVLAETNQGNDH